MGSSEEAFFASTAIRLSSRTRPIARGLQDPEFLSYILILLFQFLLFWFVSGDHYLICIIRRNWGEGRVRREASTESQTLSGGHDRKVAVLEGVIPPSFVSKGKIITFIYSV